MMACSVGRRPTDELVCTDLMRCIDPVADYQKLARKASLNALRGRISRVLLKDVRSVMGLYELKCGGLHSVTQQFQECTFSEPFQKLRSLLPELLGLSCPVCQ